MDGHGNWYYSCNRIECTGTCVRCKSEKRTIPYGQITGLPEKLWNRCWYCSGDGCPECFNLGYGSYGVGHDFDKICVEIVKSAVVHHLQHQGRTLSRVNHSKHTCSNATGLPHAPNECDSIWKYKDIQPDRFGSPSVSKSEALRKIEANTLEWRDTGAAKREKMVREAQLREDAKRLREEKERTRERERREREESERRARERHAKEEQERLADEAEKQRQRDETERRKRDSAQRDRERIAEEQQREKQQRRREKEERQREARERYDNEEAHRKREEERFNRMNAQVHEDTQEDATQEPQAPERENESKKSGWTTLRKGFFATVLGGIVATACYFANVFGWSSVENAVLPESSAQHPAEASDVTVPSETNQSKGSSSLLTTGALVATAAIGAAGLWCARDKIKKALGHDENAPEPQAPAKTKPETKVSRPRPAIAKPTGKEESSNMIFYIVVIGLMILFAVNMIALVINSNRNPVLGEPQPDAWVKPDIENGLRRRDTCGLGLSGPLPRHTRRTRTISRAVIMPSNQEVEGLIYPNGRPVNHPLSHFKKNVLGTTSPRAVPKAGYLPEEHPFSVFKQRVMRSPHQSPEFDEESEVFV